MRYVFILMIGCIHAAGYGQHMIAVGEPLPDVHLQMYNAPGTTMQLSAMRGKALIIDFWATTCIPCVKALPKVDSLHDLFKNDLNVLLVNSWNRGGDDIKQLSATYQMVRKRRPSFNLPTAYKDEILTLSSGHQQIPHYVWVDKEGIVRAITSTEELTTVKIRKFLNGQYDDIVMKYETNVTKPLFTAASLPLDRLTKYSILLRGNKGVTTEGSSWKTKEGKRYRIAWTDASLSRIYSSLARQAGFGSKLFRDEDGVLAKDSGSYSYEFMVPEKMADRFSPMILQDLETYLGISAKVEKRQAKCWVILQAGADQTQNNDVRASWFFDTQKNEITITDHTLNSMCEYLNNEVLTPVPILINESSAKGKITIKFNSENIELLRTELRKYNLDVREEKRMIDFFVVRKNGLN